MGGKGRASLAELSTKSRAPRNMVKLRNSKGETLVFNVYRDKDLGFNEGDLQLLEESIIESVNSLKLSFHIVLRRGLGHGRGGAAGGEGLEPERPGGPPKGSLEPAVCAGARQLPEDPASDGPWLGLALPRKLVTLCYRIDSRSNQLIT